jgi:hypothetical protein
MSMLYVFLVVSWCLPTSSLLFTSFATFIKNKIIFSHTIPLENYYFDAIILDMKSNTPYLLLLFFFLQLKVQKNHNFTKKKSWPKEELTRLKGEHVSYAMFTICHVWAMFVIEFATIVVNSKKHCLSCLQIAPQSLCYRIVSKRHPKKISTPTSLSFSSLLFFIYAPFFSLTTRFQFFEINYSKNKNLLRLRFLHNLLSSTTYQISLFRPK